MGTIIFPFDPDKYKNRLNEEDLEGYEWVIGDLKKIYNCAYYKRQNCEGDITNGTLDFCEKLFAENDEELHAALKTANAQIDCRVQFIDPFEDEFWGNVLEKAKQYIVNDDAEAVSNFTQELKELIEKEKFSSEFKGFFKDESEKEYYAHRFAKKYGVLQN